MYVLFVDGREERERERVQTSEPHLVDEKSVVECQPGRFSCIYIHLYTIEGFKIPQSLQRYCTHVLCCLRVPFFIFLFFFGYPCLSLADMGEEGRGRERERVRKKAVYIEH